MRCPDNVPSDVSRVQLDDLTRIVHSEIPGQPRRGAEELSARFVLVDNVIPGGMSSAAHKSRGSGGLGVWVDLPKAFPKQRF